MSDTTIFQFLRRMAKEHKYELAASVGRKGHELYDNSAKPEKPSAVLHYATYGQIAAFYIQQGWLTEEDWRDMQKAQKAPPPVIRVNPDPTAPNWARARRQQTERDS